MKARTPVLLRAPAKTLGALDAGATARLVAAAGDVALILDRDGRILDLALSDADLGIGENWVGENWADTVTIESKRKIAAMLADAASGQSSSWRQVNHPTETSDIPVRYQAVPLGHHGRIVAIGHDLQAMAAMQQRMIQAQQSLERDYMRLRQAESRYRLVFDMGTEPLLIVDQASRVIREINPAAAALARAKPAALTGKPFSAIFSVDDRDDVIAYLGAVGATEGAAPVEAHIVDGEAAVRISASSLRQGNDNLLLIRLLATDSGTASSCDSQISKMAELLPDGLVLADGALRIVAANAAFLELAQVASLSRIEAQSLDNFVGRVGIDLNLIIDQLREHGSARSIATVVRGVGGGQEEVELSGVLVPGEQGHMYGFSVRSIARRLRDLPTGDGALPRSVEQLTGLVGRMSLKDIVRESTDLIERLCIEAALQHTADNRASAAEILGVSRQSLYSKLHRHGLGNLIS